MMWLTLVIAVEFGLSWILPEVGRSLAPTALLVAAGGLAVGFVGYFVALKLTDRDDFAVATSVRRSLGTGAFALPFLGLIWNLPDVSRLLQPVGLASAGGAIVLVGVALVTDRRHPSEPFIPISLWILGLAGVLLASSLLWMVPNGLSLKFAVTYEARLEQLVSIQALKVPTACISVDVPGFGPDSQVCGDNWDNSVEFTGSRSSTSGGSYGYLYAPGMTYGTAPPDSCVVHLIGPWWQEGPTDGTGCPGGFSALPGP